MKSKNVNYEEMLKAADDYWRAAEIICDADNKLFNQYRLLLAFSGEVYLKYILLKKGYSNNIEKHDLLYLYNRLDKRIQNEINDILIKQPKKYRPLWYEPYTLNHYIEELEKNRFLVMNSRYYYEDYKKEFWIYTEGIYEIIRAFRTYAHDCESSQ